MTTTTLYRHFDSNDNLLYIGISLSEFNRFKQHMVNSEWSIDTAYTTYVRYNTREEALKMERDSIIRERPLYNTIHNNGIKGLIKRMDRIVQYLVNHKNPITDKERFHKNVQRWIDEYNSIKRMMDIDSWSGYCSERGYFVTHDGYQFV